MILNLYYRIWSDCILLAQAKPNNKNDWKYMTMLFMSMAMSLNFMTFMVFMQHVLFKKIYYNIYFDIFPGEKLDNLISYFILFLFPCIVLNYFLVMRDNRYETMVEKYSSSTKSIFIPYFLCSLFFPLIMLILWKVLF